MAKDWKQVGGDVNPKNHGAILVRVDESGVEVVRIEPNDEGAGWYVTTSHYYKDDLEWGGQAKPQEMARSMDFDEKEWAETDLANRGAIAMQYHGGGWSGDTNLVKKWSQALPAKTNQIAWWR